MSEAKVKIIEYHWPWILQLGYLFVKAASNVSSLRDMSRLTVRVNCFLAKNLTIGAITLTISNDVSI